MLSGLPDLCNKVVFAAGADSGTVFGLPLGQVAQPAHVEIANGECYVDSK